MRRFGVGLVSCFFKSGERIASSRPSRCRGVSWLNFRANEALGDFGSSDGDSIAGSLGFRCGASAVKLENFLVNADGGFRSRCAL